MFKDSLYYAKILLFGEYGIIEDSMGLSMPYHFFKGAFAFYENPDAIQTKSNQDIRTFYNYLVTLKDQSNLPCSMQLEKLRRHINQGLYFDSSIPQGFGVGSSGALVAGIYSHYAENPIAQETVMKGNNLSDLKHILSKLESFFHGKSSGLDPLICYLNLPILIKGKGDLGTVGIPIENSAGKGAIFLLNSGSPGKTQNMVSIFLNRLKEDGFRNMVKTRLNKRNEACVQSFLTGDSAQLFFNIKGLSQLLFDNFRPMIPDHFEDIWMQGLRTDAYYLKLCGSGGGGFVLGFTKDLAATESMLKDHKLQVIYKL